MTTDGGRPPGPTVSTLRTGRILELSLSSAPAAFVSFVAASDFESSLVETIDAAQWSPPSPDPSGITFVSGSSRLIVTDGEVEETVGGITHFQGANLWETTLDGSVIRSANISKINPTVVPMTDEPTGITFDPASGHYFVTEDGGKRVYNLNPGADQLIGTSDDSWNFFRTTCSATATPRASPSTRRTTGCSSPTASTGRSTSTRQPARSSVSSTSRPTGWRTPRRSSSTRRAEPSSCSRTARAGRSSSRPRSAERCSRRSTWTPPAHTSRPASPTPRPATAPERCGSTSPTAASTTTTTPTSSTARSTR